MCHCTAAYQAAEGLVDIGRSPPLRFCKAVKGAPHGQGEISIGPFPDKKIFINLVNAMVKVVPFPEFCTVHTSSKCFGRNTRPPAEYPSPHDISSKIQEQNSRPHVEHLLQIPSDTPLRILKAAWSEKFSRYLSVLETYGTKLHLIPAPVSSLGGYQPDSYRAIGSVITTTASRALSSLRAARIILFQRHAALLVKNNAECLMSGFISGI